MQFAAATNNAKSTFSEDSPWIGKNTLAHGYALFKLGRHEEAEPELRASHATILAAFGPNQSLSRFASKRMIEFLDTTKRKADADEWRRRYLPDKDGD